MNPTTPSKRILVVDDNEDAAELVGQLLTTHGHEVVVVNDALAALAAFRDFCPDVALLDIGLPVIDGYQLAAKTRAAHGNACKLVALTGHGEPQDRARAVEAGFDAYLIKPVKLSSLLAAISSPRT